MGCHVIFIGLEKEAKKIMSGRNIQLMETQPFEVRADEVPETYVETVRRLAAAQKSAGLHAPAYSRFVNRKLGRLLAAWAYRAGLSSNAVTGISAVFTFSGIFLLVVFPPSALLGALVGSLLIVGYAFDSADGQVARLRGGGSPSGEWLDHMADAIKISALPLFMMIGFYRFNAAPDWWLLVPIGAAIVGAALFFGMILTEQLRRQVGATPTVAVNADGKTFWLRSVLVLPMDYGVLCLSFFLLGVLPVFLTAYTFITVATAAFFLLAAVKWFRELRAVSSESSISAPGGAK